MRHPNNIEILEQQAKDILTLRSEAEANLKRLDLEQKKLNDEIHQLRQWSGLPPSAEFNETSEAAKAKEFLINAGVVVEVEGLFSNIPYDIVLFSTLHRYIFLNDAAVKDPVLKEWMIGKTEEEYCLRTGKDVAEITARNAHFESVLNTKLLIEWEEKVSDNKGGWLYFLRRLQPLVDEQGQVKAVIGFGLNIFEKIKAGRQLPRSEKLYKDLFYHSLALICTHDMEGKILSVNPATCVLLQYTEKELVGRFIYNFMPDKRREEFIQVYLPSIQKQKLTQGVLSVFSRSGEKVYLLIQSFKVEEEGANTFIIGFSQDITERITAEKKVLNAKKITEQSAKAKETFLANLSHEIRTPMNGILGIAGLLSKTVLNEQQANFLKLIQDSANNLLAIVNDVLDLEKIVLGKLQLEAIPFKLTDKVALTVQSFIYRAEEKGVAIITHYDVPANLVVTGDAFRLSQILNNFLNNALKFTEQGSITVRTWLTTSENGIMDANFSISDTGIGINKEVMANLFEPFVQAHASISRKYGGTGLGLGICKNLIEMQGGTLTVQSEEGAGSTFAFTIPYTLVPEQTSIPELPPPVDFSSLGKRKVLVAEDVELNQFIAKHIMESWGFEVVLASNGRQAINMIHQQDFDLVLMDVQMPEMDGITATKKIRSMKDPAKASVPIIALTANALKNDSENYLAAGMNDYISKPFLETRLFQVISRNLGPRPVENPNPIQTTIFGDVPGEAAPLYDLSMIISVSGGDEEFVKKMIALFIETVPENLVELNTALQNENWDMISKTAHKLKSTFDSMGIHSLSQIVRTVESTSKKKEFLENIPALIRRINQVIENCITQLEAELTVEAGNSVSSAFPQ